MKRNTPDDDWSLKKLHEAMYKDAERRLEIFNYVLHDTDPERSNKKAVEHLGRDLGIKSLQ